MFRVCGIVYVADHSPGDLRMEVETHTGFAVEQNCSVLARNFRSPHEGSDGQQPQMLENGINSRGHRLRLTIDVERESPAQNA